ncbi:MAG: tetratricopeptide repeat protein [Anaerolineae bacterium]
MTEASRTTLTVCCRLIGLALGLVVACAAPVAPDNSPLSAPLYTRTPVPTATPVPPTPTWSPQMLYQEGLNRRAGWDLDTALERFSAALALAPDMIPVYASRAELYRLSGHYDAAAADIARALSLNPESVEAWREKAWLHRDEAAWEEALEAVNALIELQPDDGAAYVLRAQIHAEGLGKLRLALGDYDRAIARDPLFDQATLVERWHILATLERWDDALVVSRKMFTIGDENPLRYYYRAWSLMQLGELDLAIQTLFSGIWHYPDYPVAFYYALGVAYYERQAWEETVQALEVVLAQSDTPFDERSPWQHLGITAADILGRMGVAYLELGQCQTGAAVAKQAAVEDPKNWDWAVEGIEACYLALTPTPEPEP